MTFWLRVNMISVKCRSFLMGIYDNVTLLVVLFDQNVKIFTCNGRSPKQRDCADLTRKPGHIYVKQANACALRNNDRKI